MKSIIKGLVTALMLVTGVAASAAQDIQIYTADNSKGKITGATIQKAFADSGFLISGNNDMNVAFKSKFQKTNHKMYHLFTLYKKDLVLELVKISPKAALFAPLSMSIYMKKDSNDISISSISLDGMAKVTGIPASNKHMIEYSNLVRATLAKALPNGHFEKTSYKIGTPKGELITSFTAEMEAQGDAVEDELEGLQTELEGSLETAGFVIAGFNKLGDEFAEAGYNKYDFFDAYSICKLPVIFEVAKTHPEAGAFAPCTFYMYKEKGATEVQMAYPSVYNWISSLDIEDEPSIKVLEDAQKTMVRVVKEVTE
ncbi:protein containing DUF302 [Sulfurimonas gotlandica GD1]|uniref:Protein containing DUF302 n=1 Tax=Sulfurimonas gotlandica (strain DSM 19862 / JCM 16533 / GD1) TaxID=929558 RepID=B6BGQ2_SULGG|nr:hypothetical protein [Sulfurimonas gotlandica]EDZ63379.1 conserved hypothetical protein [Sulfurimonas gotlandica GD1]EHP29683.1 protein containing DUF302 [Sulfurimonas gotlandica GD1]